MRNNKDYKEFEIWLQESKCFSKRSAEDVASRLRRIKRILKTDTITSKSLDKLNLSVDFMACNRTVKQQLRHAINLYLEYLE